MSESSRALNRPVRGWWAAVGDVNAMVLPEELLRKGALGVAVGVATFREPGEPWGRHLVMLVASEPNHVAMRLAAPGR